VVSRWSSVSMSVPVCLSVLPGYITNQTTPDTTPNGQDPQLQTRQRSTNPRYNLHTYLSSERPGLSSSLTVLNQTQGTQGIFDGHPGNYATDRRISLVCYGRGLGAYQGGKRSSCLPPSTRWTFSDTYRMNFVFLVSTLPKSGSLVKYKRVFNCNA